MGRWLQLARDKKKSETLKSGTDKTDRTPSGEVSSVLSVPSVTISENFLVQPAEPKGDFVSFVSSSKEGNQNFLPEQPAPPWDADDWDYAFAERAAILEYDGGHVRAEAERLARIEITAMKRRTIH